VLLRAHLRFHLPLGKCFTATLGRRVAVVRSLLGTHWHCRVAVVRSLLGTGHWHCRVAVCYSEHLCDFTSYWGDALRPDWAYDTSSSRTILLPTGEMLYDHTGPVILRTPLRFYLTSGPQRAGTTPCPQDGHDDHQDGQDGQVRHDGSNAYTRRLQCHADNDNHFIPRQDAQMKRK
jgi:hypothetical protein